MADYFNPVFKQRVNPYSPEPIQFQRSSGKVKRKKIQRKIRLRVRHILFFFILQMGIFVAIQQTYLFLMTWDKLTIEDVEIVTQRPEVKAEIQSLLEGKKLGNILLLDIEHLRKHLTAPRWVKEVRVRKILPSTLRIETKERIPVALLKKNDAIYLIDKQGTLLERVERGIEINLPLLMDRGNFTKNYEEKLTLAWECIQNLSPEEKDELDVLDLSEHENITVQLKNNRTKLILGDTGFSHKLKLFHKFRAKLEVYGDLDYVDLRLEDRIYIRPMRNPFTHGLVPRANKEAN